jgi:chromosome segregation ATPase
VERDREIKAADQNVDELMLQISDFAEKSEEAETDLQASEQQREAQATEIEALQSEVLDLREGSRQKQMEFESGKEALTGANRRAEGYQEELKKVTLALKASEEKRKDLVMEIESMQLALDDANARAASSEQMAKHATRLLKEELLAAEEKKQAQQAELDAKVQVELEACDQQRRIHEAEMQECRQELQKADAKAKKYKDYAKHVKMQLEASLKDDAENEDLFFVM